MNNGIDIERLRGDLLDYVGSALPFFPISINDIIQIESARDEELIKIAYDFGFDLSMYRYEKVR